MKSRHTLDKLVTILRTAGILLLLTLVVGSIGGSSCYYHHDDDDNCRQDDDDFSCDDDDHHHGSSASSPNTGSTTPRGPSSTPERTGSYGAYDPGQVKTINTGESDIYLPSPDALAAANRLQTFDLVKSVEDGAHPIRRITHIEGVSIFASYGAGEFGSETFQEFASSILSANQHLLGLPAAAGTHAFHEVTFSSEAILVSYLQVMSDEKPLPGASVIFLFDRLGELREIENTTWAHPEIETSLIGQ